MSQLENIKTQHQQGEYQQAIEGYLDLLAKEPNNDEAHFGLAHAYSQTQQLEQALVHAKEAVNLNPNSDRHLQFKGQMLLANQQLDEALRAFKHSIKENPNLFYSYLAIGDIYAIKNESQKAKKNYNLALKVHQEGIPAIVKLSRLLMIEGDYASAEDLLQRNELQYPTDPNIKLQMGILRLEQDEEGFAELYFKKLLEDEPNNHVAKAYLGISLQQSNPQQANQVITELLNDKIKIPELMAAVGLSYANHGRFTEAIQYLTPVCQSGLAYPSWLLALAQAYVGNSQPNSAMTVLNEVLKRGNNSKALLMLAQIHQVNNNYPTAIKTYQRVDKSSKHYIQSLLMQAECHYANGDYAAVLKQLEPVLAEQPDHSAAIKLQLNTLSELYQIDEALAVVEGVNSDRQIPAFNQLMHLYAGLLLDEKKQFDQAWQRFSAIEPHQPAEIDLLSSDEEKVVQQFESKSTSSVFKFVFSDPATGHHDFINWLLDNNITPLVDRYTNQPRHDVFAEQWTIKMLDDLSKAQIHFLRKKYVKQLQQLIDPESNTVVDFMPISPINLAVIKRIFPQAHVLVLSRNSADLRLHSQVYGSHQVHYTQFAKVANQMVAMNPNVGLIDIDAWQNEDEAATENIERIFGSDVKPFNKTAVKPLNRLMFPFMHWKNYQQHLSD